MYVCECVCACISVCLYGWEEAAVNVWCLDPSPLILDFLPGVRNVNLVLQPHSTSSHFTPESSTLTASTAGFYATLFLKELFIIQALNFIFHTIQNLLARPTLKIVGDRRQEYFPLLKLLRISTENTVPSLFNNPAHPVQVITGEITVHGDYSQRQQA